jgi:uncharacterized membrane protein (DUF485 family)
MSELSETERKRNVRRTALFLTALALFFYFGFIALSVFRTP